MFLNFYCLASHSDILKLDSIIFLTLLLEFGKEESFLDCDLPYENRNDLVVEVSVYSLH